MSGSTSTTCPHQNQLACPRPNRSSPHGFGGRWRCNIRYSPVRAESPWGGLNPAGSLPQLDPPCVLALLTVSVVLSPWRSQALPLHHKNVRFVPVMINRPIPPPLGQGLAPAPEPLSIINHNCLRSWNVFLSLFELLKEATTYPSIVFLQDPPVNKALLPSFNGFKSFFPPARKPHMAAYIHMSFLSSYTVFPKFKGVEDVLALDISADEPLFGTTFHSFRLINAYSTNTADNRVHSVYPEDLFPDLGFPLLVLGDLNIHNPLADPLRHFSQREISSSTPSFEKVTEAGLALLNPPGQYTRFPLVENAPPSVIDLAFANPPLLPLIKSWEASLPSTGSDHIPITITLATPSLNRIPPRPHWADTDWEALDLIIKGFKVPAALLRPTPPQLDEWMSESLNRLIALLKEHTPVSRPSHHSKPWWTPTCLSSVVNIIRPREGPGNTTPHACGKSPAPPGWGISRPSRPLKTNTGPLSC